MRRADGIPTGFPVRFLLGRQQTQADSTRAAQHGCAMRDKPGATKASNKPTLERSLHLCRVVSLSEPCCWIAMARDRQVRHALGKNGGVRRRPRPIRRRKRKGYRYFRRRSPLDDHRRDNRTAGDRRGALRQSQIVADGAQGRTVLVAHLMLLGGQERRFTRARRMGGGTIRFMVVRIGTRVSRGGQKVQTFTADANCDE